MRIVELHSRRLRRAVAIIVVLGLLYLLGWIVDSLVAARAESRLSQQVSQSAELQAEPRTFLGGFPFLQVLWSHEIPHASVSTLDVDVQSLGIVNTQSEAYNLEIAPQDALNGYIIGAPVSSVKRSVSLDGVSMGQLLSMTDLDIQNPYDISPAGGRAAEAQLTGTPPGFEEAVTVLVTLRLEGEVFRMDVAEILSAPEGREADAAAAFTLHMDSRRFPIGGRATSVFVRGGSISLEHSRYHTTITASDLAPLATGDSDFTTAAEQN